jgi:uncharacterized hydrophobic protein (TIGR00271 family)
MAPSLLPHVDESRLNALQSRLEDISEISIDFLVLLSGSTVIATLGLFQNSPAVIIGAMIIAPLMRPLVGLSLATLTADTRLLVRALVTLFVGTIVSVTIAATMALFFRSLEPTAEILARTQPTLLDLGVALFAGAVGAYCQTNEKLAETLAGVAISVALVPPLAVVGIGLAFGSLSVWTGAALLYATNLVGITMAGALVFLLFGYTPLKQAKKGLAVSAAAITLLVVPLAFSMRELVLENVISAKIRTILKEKTFTFRSVQLQDLKVLRFRMPMQVKATVVSSDQPITSHQVRLVQDFLNREIGVPIEFRLRIIPATELTAIEMPAQQHLPSLPRAIERADTVRTPTEEVEQQPVPHDQAQKGELGPDAEPSPIESQSGPNQ